MATTMPAGLLGAETLHARVEDIKRRKGAAPWVEKVVVNDADVGHAHLPAPRPRHRSSLSSGATSGGSCWKARSTGRSRAAPRSFAPAPATSSLHRPGTITTSAPRATVPRSVWPSRRWASSIATIVPPAKGRTAADSTMARRTVEVGPTFEGWQAAARALLHDEVPPEDVKWREGEPTTPPAAPSKVRVPREFVELARRAAEAADPERWALLYEILWRLAHDERDLLAHPRRPPGGAPQDARAQGQRKPRPPGRRSRRRAPAPSSRPAPRSTSFDRPAPTAGAAISTVTPPRRSSARARPTCRVMLVGEQPGDQEDRRARRSSGRRARSSTGRWSRPASTARSLRDQRGEALQVHRARQAAHPRDAERAGDHRVPAVAGGGAGGHPAGGARRASAPPRPARSSVPSSG